MISYICKISEPAARKRFFEYNNWKSHINANDEYDRKMFFYYYSFLYKRKCNNCGTGIIQQKGKFCPICGRKGTLEWGDGDTMKYPLLPTQESGKLKECPICHNEETDIFGNYCQICGSQLVNMCTNANCYASLPSNARYCPVCGQKSTFFNLNYLKKWDYKEKPTFFMHIPDSIIDEELPFN